MKTYRRILRLELIAVPIIAIIIYITGTIIYNHQQAAYKPISIQQFHDTVVKYKIDEWVRVLGENERKYEINLPDNKGKYYTELLSYEDEDKYFKGLINNTEYSNPLWETLLQMTAVGTGMLFCLNIVILWFVCLYDLLKSEFTYPHNKWIWFISLILLFFIAPFFYLFISGRQKAVAP